MLTTMLRPRDRCARSSSSAARTARRGQPRLLTGPRRTSKLLLKSKLAQQLELFQLDPDRPFVMRCDASGFAIGAVLEQAHPDEATVQDIEIGKTRLVPVSFFSRKLTGSQLNWTPREKETYAIVAALRKWAGHINFQPVIVVTDHRSLQHWVTEDVDTPSGPRGRRARWHETLS